MVTQAIDPGKLKSLASQADEERFDVAAVWLYKKLVELQPNNDAMWYKLSDSLSAIGFQSDAIAALANVKNIPESRRGQVRLLRAKIEEGMGNLSAAEAELRQAVALNSKSTVPWAFLAAFLAKHNRVSEAITVLRECIKSGAVGDQDEVHHLLGLHLMAIGEYELAKVELKNALNKANGSYPEADKALAELEFLNSVMSAAAPTPEG
jgi:tetratricopeptide (TPR) repeat protein